MGKLMTIDEYITVRFTPASAPSKRMINKILGDDHEETANN